MPYYAYRVRNEAALPVTGTLHAASRQQAADRLRKMGYVVVALRPAWPLRLFTTSLTSPPRVRTLDLTMFTLQLADMVGAGLTLLTALQTFERQTENRTLKSVADDCRAAIEGGLPLSEAFAKHPRVFPNLYIQMVRAGEASGNLDVVLRRLSQHLENQEELRRRFVSALTYPALLVAASIAVSAIVIVWVIPSFVDMFSRSGIPLPAPTRALHAVGIAVRKGWPALLALGAGAAFLFFRARRRPDLRLKMDRLSLRIPRLGDLLRKQAVARFSSTLGLLVSSGVPILEAIELTEKSAGHAVFEQVLRSARQGVSEGISLSQALSIGGALPADALEMISSGEQSGRLDAMLEKLSEIYARGVDYSLKRFAALLEPVLLVFMGGIVAIIMSSVMLPVLNMVKLLQRRG